MIITDFDDDRLLKSGYINEASHDFSWDLILEYITKAGIEIEDITVKRNFSLFDEDVLGELGNNGKD